MISKQSKKYLKDLKTIFNKVILKLEHLLTLSDLYTFKIMNFNYYLLFKRIRLLILLFSLDSLFFLIMEAMISEMI